MTNADPPPGPGWRPLVFAAAFVLSLLPLTLLDLAKAVQLTSAVALPVSVLLAIIPLLPAARRRWPRPRSWRRLLLTAAVVVAVLGASGVAYAVWQNTKDLPVVLGSGAGTPGEHWKDKSQTTMLVPGGAPARDHLTVSVSLTNINETGDCERTGTLEFIPVLDGRPGTPVPDQPPGRDVELSLAGAAHEAKIIVVLHYDARGAGCQVDLRIDRSVLHD